MKVKGVLEVKSGGYGFIRGEDTDYFIPASDMGGAVHGQTVLAYVEPYTTRGEVISVLSPYPEIVGVLHKRKKNSYVAPDMDVYEDIIIRNGQDMGASDGDKVVAVIKKPGSYDYPPSGRVTEILGKSTDTGLDVLSVARSYGIKPGFPKGTELYATNLKSFPDNVTRKDFTGKRIFTIDGDDAKDLDDAVSVEKLENGSYLLGVHIADVSHYVRMGDPVDLEARKRGTSVYFPDMVAPMLPQILSNDLCSLNPGEDKLTLSCIMEISGEGEVIASDIVKSRIRSCARLTYNGVNGFYDSGSSDAVPDCLKADLELLLELSVILKSVREAHGSIDFDFDEPEFVFDEGGRVKDIVVKPRGRAEKVIEECMLAANMTVARTYRLMEMPFIYRVHEKPDGSAMHNLSVFLSGLGIPLKGNQNIHPGALQDVLKRVKDRPEAAVVNRMVLKSLKKARYDALAEGHFGLAADDYCHFTSPIRRYPDLMVHRIISAVTEGAVCEEDILKLEKLLPRIADKSSELERRAVEAERAVRDRKMAQFMENKVGETFSGIVSGVTGFGVFVELENTAEGMIHEYTLDDEYRPDRTGSMLVGTFTKKKIKIGDPIRVKCVRVDTANGRIEFYRL